MFVLGGPEHALVQEWKDLNSGRARIASQNDSMKAVVTLHPNQVASVSPCTKGAAKNWRASTRRWRHGCSFY